MGPLIDPEFDKALDALGPNRPVSGFVSWNKHHAEVFRFGEPLVVTELLTGFPVRATVDADGTLYVGSYDEWKEQHPSSPYWKGFRWATNLEKFLRDFPGLTVYGTAYGTFVGSDYGRGGHVAFALEDLLAADGLWVSHDKARNMTRPYEVPWTPVIERCGYKPSHIESLAYGPSLMVSPSNDKDRSVQRRSGIVVKPPIERSHPIMGRAVLMLFANA